MMIRRKKVFATNGKKSVRESEEKRGEGVERSLGRPWKTQKRKLLLVRIRDHGVENEGIELKNPKGGERVGQMKKRKRGTNFYRPNSETQT